MATHDHSHARAAAHLPVAAHAHAVVPGADKRPAFVGLIVGGIMLFAILFGVVKATESHFASEGGEHPAAAGAEHK